ncbi:MAG TPA: MFS transporter [Chloroflexota bacterium]|nr:MFS transporter [Chloroflexota bacterium]
MSRSAASPWVMLGVAILAQVGCSFLHQGLPSLAPLFQAEWALSRGELGGVLAAINVGVLLASVAAGQLVDRVGERWPMVLAPGGVAALAVLASLSPTPWLLALALATAGAFVALSGTAGGKATLLWFPARVRGLAMSLRQTGVSIGGVSSALLLPLCASAFGWRGALLAAAAVGGLAALTVLALYRDPPTSTGAAARAAPGWQTISALLHDRSLVATFVLGPLLVAGQWTVLPYLVLFLYERFGWGVSEAARYLALAQIGAIGGRIAWGLASDVFWRGRRKPALGLLVPASALGTLALAILPPWTPALAVALLAGWLGATVIGWNGVLFVYTAEQAGPQRAGTALGLLGTSVFTSAVLVPPLFGWLVDRLGSYTPAWLLLSGVLLAGLALFPFLREVETVR